MFNQCCKESPTLQQSSHPKVESRVESFYYLVKSSRVNGYANCTVNKNASLQVETCLSASRITFYFFKLFQDSSQPIQLQYFWWIYPEQVVAELTRVVYGKNQQDESFGTVDSSHFSYSSRVAKMIRVRVNDSTCYNTVFNTESVTSNISCKSFKT
jgi:hypothetical protein